MIRTLLKEHYWILAILTLTIIVFMPTLSNDFVNWDDEVYIHSSKMVHGFSIPNIREAFSTREYHGAYTPLTHISWSIDYSIGGQSARVYHIHNLLLHLINTVLIYLLISKLVNRKSLGLITALLFAIHPIHVEPVAWISSRKDLLFAMYFLAALLSYLYYLKKAENKNLLLVTFIFFAMSLMSKGVAFTLPLVLILLDYFDNRQFTRPVWLEKLPFFGLSLVFAYLAYTGQQSIGATDGLNTSDFGHSILYAGFGFVTYLIKSIIPFEIGNFYPYPSSGPGAIFYIYTGIGLMLCLTAIKFRKNNKLVFFGFLFFAITVSPVLQFVSFGATLMADRFVYIPYIGLFLIMAWFGTKLWKNTAISNLLKIAIASTIVLVMGYMSYTQSMIWENGETLWTDAISKNPDNHNVYAHRANYYQSVGEFHKAKKDYSRSIDRNPTYAFALNNRGLLYMRSDQLDSAFIDFNAAIESSKFEAAYLNRGIIYARKKEYQKALADLDTIAESMKNDPLLYYNRGSIYYNINQDSLAIIDLEKSRELGLNDYRLSKMLGKLYDKKGWIDMAQERFEDCLNANPEDIDCLHGMALALYTNGHYKEAIPFLNQVIELNSDNENAYTDLGLMYLNLGSYDQAISNFDHALSLDSTQFQPWYNKAIAYKLQGKDFESGILAISKVMELRPDIIDAYVERAEIQNEMGNTSGARADLSSYFDLLGNQKPSPKSMELQALLN